MQWSFQIRNTFFRPTGNVRDIELKLDAPIFAEQGQTLFSICVL